MRSLGGEDEGAQQQSRNTGPTTLAIHSPLAAVPATAKCEIEDFLLSLPLGTDSDSAVIEAEVANRLFEAEVAKAGLQNKLQQWYV